MTKGRIIVGCLLLAGVATAVIFYPREPEVDGRRLGDWIQIMQTSRNQADREGARIVISQLDTNNAAVLLRWLDKETVYAPSIMQRANTLLGRLDVWFFGQGIHPVWRWPVSSGPMRLDHASMAMWAIPELGAKSRGFAIHDLIQRLGNTNEWIMGSAWLTLTKMAPESVDPLCEALTNADPQVRVGAASALGEIRPPVLSCVPALELLLADTNVEVVVDAAESLGKLGCEPEVFIPVVIQTLTKAKLSDPDELFTTLEVLAKYTNESVAAIPILLKILERTSHSNDQTNQAIHQQVQDAIRVIDPKAIGQEPSPANGVLPSKTN